MESRPLPLNQNYGTFTCPFDSCKREFFASNAYETHLHYHNNQGLSCGSCGVIFCLSSEFEAHLGSRAHNRKLQETGRMKRMRVPRNMNSGKSSSNLHLDDSLVESGLLLSPSSSMEFSRSNSTKCEW